MENRESQNIVFVTHAGDIVDRNTPEQMWDKLYRHHANIDFILSGDQSTVTAHRIESKADDGHVITAVPLRVKR